MAAPPAALPSIQPQTHAQPPAGSQLGTRLRHASQRASRAIERLRAAAFDADSATALSTCLSILDALIRQPAQPRVRCLRMANPRFAGAVGRWPAAVEVLKAAGFEEVDETVAGAGMGAGVGGGAGTARVLLLREEGEDDDVTLTVREAVAAALTAMGPAVPPPPPAPAVDYGAREAAAAAAAAVQAAFDPFRPMVLRPTGEAEAITSASSTSIAGAATGSSSGSGVGGGFAAGGAGGAAAGGAGAAAGSAAASRTPAAAAGVDDDREMTATDRQVAALKASAAELQAANRPPAHRCTRIAIYNPLPLPQAQTQASAGGGEAASAGAGGAGGAGLVGVRESKRPDAGDRDRGRDRDRDDDAPDAEASALMAEYARKKMIEARDGGDKPLMTAAQRQLESLKSARVFTSTSIKVQLPDRSLVTGVFSPLDSLADVYAWLRGGAVLSPLAAALPFYLFSTPPPQQHREDASTTLAEAKLVPSKHLHLAFGTGVGARLTPGTRVPAPAGWTAGSAVDGDGTVAVPASADELLSPAALAAAMDAAGDADGDAGAGGIGGAVALHGARPGAAAAAGAASSSSATGAAPAATASSPLSIDDAELDRMAAQLLAGGGMGGVGALRPTAASAAGAAGAAGSAAAGGAGAGGAGSSASGASGSSKGKPSWLRI